MRVGSVLGDTILCRVLLMVSTKPTITFCCRGN